VLLARAGALGLPAPGELLEREEDSSQKVLIVGVGHSLLDGDGDFGDVILPAAQDRRLLFLGQRLVAEDLTLRVTPRLSFVLDTSIERGFNLTRKLEGLRIEPPQP